jgi:hypothetical protein
MKNNLFQSTIGVGADREFNPNVQLSAEQLPQQSDSEEVLREFKRSYEFLNFLNYSEDYEIRLHRGKGALMDERMRATNELLKDKEKLKSAFLSQIDAIVDNYIQKTLH